MSNRTLALMVMQITALVGYTNAAGSSPENPQVIDLPVKFIGFDGKEVRPDMRPYHLSLQWALVPGGFHGDRTLQNLDTQYIGGQTSIRLDLTHLAEKFAPKAAPTTPSEEAGLEVTPTEAHLARAIPGMWFRISHNIKMKSGFYDADTRETLLLVYFDRPCHMSGIDTTRQSIPLESPPKVDVGVDAPGWVWIVIKKTGPSTYTELRAPSPHPVLLMAPYDRDLYRKYQEGSN